MDEFETRFSEIRKIAELSKEHGLNRRERREAVIDIEGAISKKTVKVKDGLDPAEIHSIGKKDIRTESKEVIDRAIKKYFNSEISDKNIPVVVECLHGNTETNIERIARRVATRLGSSLMIAKKPRQHAEGNQDWWRGKSNKERSRSIRAARFWSVDKILNKLSLLNGQMKLDKNFYQLSLHGMVDGNGFDIGIASCYEPADPEILKRFQELVQSKMGSYKVDTIGSSHEMADRYSGYRSLANFRSEPEEEKDRHHPDYGKKFNTFQVEISNRLRTNRDKRNMVVNALTFAIKKLQDEN